ncbi:hypothetical protein C8R42DRAFT_298760 [Lentinula raphanica]|nr:hypothetical protein C8R42DRAFT_298760 [Lentinula raphanica]
MERMTGRVIGFLQRPLSRFFFVFCLYPSSSLFAPLSGCDGEEYPCPFLSSQRPHARLENRSTPGAKKASTSTDRWQWFPLAFPLPQSAVQLLSRGRLKLCRRFPNPRKPKR